MRCRVAGPRQLDSAEHVSGVCRGARYDAEGARLGGSGLLCISDRARVDKMSGPRGSDWLAIQRLPVDVE